MEQIKNLLKSSVKHHELSFIYIILDHDHVKIIEHINESICDRSIRFILENYSIDPTINLKTIHNISKYHLCDLFNILDDSRVDHNVVAIVENSEILYEIEQICNMTNTSLLS
jgi:hypothetical protein